MRALLATLALSLVARAEPVFLDRVAVDGTGHFIAAVRGGLNNALLAEWSDAQWVPLPIRRDRHSGAIKELITLPDGTIGVLRWLRENVWGFSVLRGRELLPPVEFDWPRSLADEVELTADSTGAVWLSGNTDTVIRIHGHRAETLTLAAFASKPFPRWNFVRVVEQPGGSVWVYTTDRASNATSLDRPLKWSDGQLVPAADFPVGGLWQILPQGSDALWVLSDKRELFSVREGRAEKIPFPQRHGPDLLFPFKDRLLVLADDALWQWHSGEWTLRRAKDDPPLRALSRSVPEFAPLETGLLLGLTRGLLFVPFASGPPVVLDWRRGFGMEQPRNFTALGGDRFAAVSTTNGTIPWLIASLADFPEPGALPVEEFRPARGWVVDARERFAMITGRDTLDVLDGESRRQIPLPDTINHSRLTQLRVDTHDRIWALGQNENEPVAILSADLEHWTAYPKAADARDTEHSLFPEAASHEPVMRKPLPLPANWPLRRIQRRSVAIDNAGFTWIAADGRLYKSRGSKTVTVFNENTPHPFTETPELESVRADRHGAVWFQLGDRHLVRLPPTGRLVQNPQLSVDATGLVSISPAPTGGEWHWRPAQGTPWRAAHPGILGYLPDGRHDLELVCVGPDLQHQGPFTQTLEVRTDSSEQAADFLKILREGPDHARELVVEALTFDPERSIPLLKNALENDGQNWWLEAALQECEREAASTSTPMDRSPSRPPAVPAHGSSRLQRPSRWSENRPRQTQSFSSSLRCSAATPPSSVSFHPTDQRRYPSSSRR